VTPGVATVIGLILGGVALLATLVVGAMYWLLNHPLD
jgi:hypothetical protein